MAETGPGPFNKIKSLKCFARVHEMVVHGFPPTEIARFIQEDRGEYTDITYESLVTTVYRYRESVVPAEAIAPRLPHYLAKKAREFGNRLEELTRLERLYDVLEYKIDLAHGHERATGIDRPEVLKMAREIRDTIMRMHEIKMDLGLSGSRDLGTLTISPERLAEIEQKYGPEAAKAYASPVSRGKVLKVVNLAIERARLMEKNRVVKERVEVEAAEYEDE